VNRRHAFALVQIREDASNLVAQVEADISAVGCRVVLWVKFLARKFGSGLGNSGVKSFQKDVKSATDATSHDVQRVM
jgi:hypothetical protein